MRKVLPTSMIILLAIFGCTTNRTPGAGQPVTATPSMSPATTYGTSYGTGPMASSYMTPASTTYASRADQAAAILRQDQAGGRQGRFLGYLNPEPIAQQPAQQYATGQLIPPSLIANPEITVNSSISSAPYPVVTGGAADIGAVNGVAGAFVLPGGTTGATTTGSIATPTGTNAAVSFGATNATTGTTALAGPNPTINAAPSPVVASPGAFATNGVSTLTPTAASGATPSPIATSNTMFGRVVVGAATAANPATTVPTTTPATGTTSTATVSPVRLATGQIVIPSSTRTAPIVVTAGANGQLIISNVSTGRVRAVRP